jgi:hypothetical protein
MIEFEANQLAIEIRIPHDAILIIVCHAEIILSILCSSIQT